MKKNVTLHKHFPYLVTFLITFSFPFAAANTLHQVASLEYANKCLVNVLLLCGQYSQPSATHAQQQVNQINQPQLACSLSLLLLSLVSFLWQSYSS